jgi:hypothetical protein
MCSPQNGMVRGIQNALASLHHASDLQFSCWGTSAACSAGSSSSSAPRDTNSEPSSLDRKNASGPRTRVVTRDRKHKLKTRHLACPFQKEDIIHGRHTTCSYEGADSMSTLRKHLAGQHHRDSLPFIDLCSSCKEYIVSKPLWESIHVMGQCISGCDKPRVQVRNSPSNQARVGAQWLRLFESIFPASQRLPSPCKSRLSIPAMIFTK